MPQLLDESIAKKQQEGLVPVQSRWSLGDADSDLTTITRPEREEDSHDVIAARLMASLVKYCALTQSVQLISTFWEDPLSEAAEPFAIAYQSIRRWHGGVAPLNEREKQRRFWTDVGKEGAKWLAWRIRDETDPEVLADVVNLLADIGNASLEPILSELEQNPSEDQSATLLKALGWIPTPWGEDALLDHLRQAVARFIRKDEPLVRESAAVAIRILADRDAEELLQEALAREQDDEVRLILEEELEERGSR